MIHTLEKIVREQPFFQGMEDRHIRLITGCAGNVHFDSGDFIFRVGEAADHFYLIRKGQVAVQFAIPSRGSRTVRTVGDGEVVGWSWLFAPYRWHFDARAQQPTLALAFDGKCLRIKCEEDHDLGYAIYTRFTRLVTDSLQATLLQLLDVYAPEHGGEPANSRIHVSA
jgi:CRP/FNR family cyclic AMP-dependent transcriptional regulator